MDPTGFPSGSHLVTHGECSSVRSRVPVMRPPHGSSRVAHASFSFGNGRTWHPVSAERVRDHRSMRGHVWSGNAAGNGSGGDRMRAKFSSWKHLLYAAAALTALALAAGARFKPN